MDLRVYPLGGVLGYQSQSLPDRLKETGAIILAGGQGRRLNCDKTRLELANGRILANIIDLCRGLFGTATLVVDRVDRINTPPPRTTIIADDIPGIGPLGGLLTGLTASPFEMNFVTACDLPFISKQLVMHIARRISKQDVIVSGRGDAVEPLVGFYSKRCIGAIQRSIDLGQFQVRGFWAGVATEIVELGDAFAGSDLDTLLLNVNTRHDLMIAEALATAEAGNPVQTEALS